MQWKRHARARSSQWARASEASSGAESTPRLRRTSNGERRGSSERSIPESSMEFTARAHWIAARIANGVSGGTRENHPTTRAEVPLPKFPTKDSSFAPLDSKIEGCRTLQFEARSTSCEHLAWAISRRTNPRHHATAHRQNESRQKRDHAKHRRMAQPFHADPKPCGSWTLLFDVVSRRGCAFPLPCTRRRFLCRVLDSYTTTPVPPPTLPRLTDPERMDETHETMAIDTHDRKKEGCFLDGYDGSDGWGIARVSIGAAPRSMNRVKDRARLY